MGTAGQGAGFVRRVPTVWRRRRTGMEGEAEEGRGEEEEEEEDEEAV